MGTIHRLRPPPNTAKDKAWATRVLTEIVALLLNENGEPLADVEFAFRQRSAEAHAALAVMSRRSASRRPDGPI